MSIPISPEAVSLSIRRTAVTLASAALVVAVPAVVAHAHVRVIPESTAAGSYSALTFRVPNESEKASTVSLEVALPTDNPLTSVRTKPVPGWTAEVVRGDLPIPVDVDGATITEAPLRIIWTAQEGAAIAPGQYQEFDVSVGPLPDAGTEILLPATQTYSDGEVVAWDTPAEDGGEEPERPAPAFDVSQGEAHGSDDDARETAGPELETAGAKATADDVVARGLSVAGLVVGAGALIVGLNRSRRSA